jgi:arabinofuranosyltransferase
MQNQATTPLEFKIKIENPLRFLRYLCLALLAVVLLRNLWVSDDAFITLRVVDNFLHGYGLVWNAGERVQVFTHPLWMFLLIPFSFLTPDPLYVFYIPSFLLSLWTISLLFRNFVVDAPRAILGTILLAGSTAFIDYSSSGLENPLTHLLAAAFLIVYLREEPVPLKRFFLLSLLAALGTLNRLDTILLFLPALIQAYLAQSGSRWKSALVALGGFAPLILWELFAVFYYGFPFPNTYYTKAATGLPLGFLLDQGAKYFVNSLHWDVLTLGTLFFGMLTLLFQRDAKRVGVAAGCLLYMLYILWIGGDFMSGRFFSAIFMAAWVLLMTFGSDQALGLIPRRNLILLLMLVLLAGLSAERPPVFVRAGQPGMPYDEFGVANEKYYYLEANGWISYTRHGGYHEFAVRGIQTRREHITPVEMNTIGMFGYYAGPDIYVFDSHALADPLRARMPVIGPSRIGHYERVVPDGYMATIESGFTENLIEDPNLRLYYEKLSILIRGDLYAPGRLQEIVRFNTGYYDGLVEEYWQEYLVSR